MKIVHVQDKFQDYTYELTEATGKNFDFEFKPDLTPQDMLKLGVFGGHYFDNYDEFPEEWIKSARISAVDDPHGNFFQVSASQPLQVWQAKGWIYEEDPRGWFQWYCRYYLGRRIPLEDARQIKRWKAIRRHVAQINKYCIPGDLTCRRRQRQALLHWAYDSRKL
jgi:hypothetical protein